MNKHFKINIQGKVQGVWYRASAQQAAQRFGLVGFVKNLPDGGVYCEVEGPEAALLDFVKWCRRGPELAKVDEVEVAESSVQGFAGFEIRR
ncbi:MAG: acylphosphatase [bacterium]|nr:acylphosphatase [bacterium]